MANPLETVASWNCKVGRDPDTVVKKVKALIDDTGAQVVALQEAKQYTEALHRRFDEHFYVYAKTGWPESTNCPLLVRRGQGNRQGYGQGWGTVRYTTPWVGPQGGHHDGRTWHWALVNGYALMSLHRCTDGDGRNSEAFQTEHDKLVAWIEAQELPVLILGDHNCGPKADYYGSSRRVAEHANGKVQAPDGGHVDYAIKRDCPGSIRLGHAYGSDHEAVVFTLG